MIKASAAPGSHWKPGLARYGVGKHLDRAVTMKDGTVLRADVYYPTARTGKEAAGKFPVLLTMTPYGKGVGDGPNQHLVQRGYIDVVADVRGTGDSEGEFGLFDPVQDTDGATLVKWAAKRAYSNGKVGTYGASYLGIDQLLTAAALNPLMLEWFDTWLKGAHTGMGKTKTPLHYYDLGAKKYTEHAQYPFKNAKATRYYFASGKKLSTARPAGAGSDTLVWSPVGNPCGRPTDQWSVGVASVVTGSVRPGTPYVDGDDQVGQLGPDRTTYTTAPLTRARTIAGPIDVSVNATATTSETQWVAQVEEVAPDGTSTPLTEGERGRRDAGQAHPRRHRRLPDVRNHREGAQHPDHVVDC